MINEPFTPQPETKNDAYMLLGKYEETSNLTDLMQFGMILHKIIKDTMGHT